MCPDHRAEPQMPFTVQYGHNAAAAALGTQGPLKFTTQWDGQANATPTASPSADDEGVNIHIPLNPATYNQPYMMTGESEDPPSLVANMGSSPAEGQMNSTAPSDPSPFPTRWRGFSQRNQHQPISFNPHLPHYGQQQSQGGSGDQADLQQLPVTTRSQPAALVRVPGKTGSSYATFHSRPGMGSSNGDGGQQMMPMTGERLTEPVTMGPHRVGANPSMAMGDQQQMSPASFGTPVMKASGSMFPSGGSGFITGGPSGYQQGGASHLRPFNYFHGRR